jgi:hypothetical protein
VFYTDEMFESTDHTDSMTLAIVVSSQVHENAMQVDNNAVTVTSYTWNSDKIQVKTHVRRDGRLAVVGLECKCRIGTLHPEILGLDEIRRLRGTLLSP